MRKLCKLVIIDEIKEHTNADSLEIAVVGGWQCVVRKGEYTPGTICLYHEIDSMLPLDDVRFSFLEGRNEYMVDGKRYARIKTMKLRKEISQGLLTRITEPSLLTLIGSLFLSGDIEWSDHADLLYMVDTLNDLIDFDARYGIIKYVSKSEAAGLSGMAKGNFPNFIPKTDQERYQNIKYAIENIPQDTTFELTVKLDGSSFTAYVNENDDGERVTGVCSRNLELKLDQEGNAFVDMFKSLNLDGKLRSYGGNIAIQGEMVGPGIQGNFEGVDERSLYIYSVYDIDAQKYLKPADAREVVRDLGLNYVPVIDPEFKLPAYNEIQSIASGPSGLKGKYREGVVLKSNNCSRSFKAISNEYLIREK